MIVVTSQNRKIEFMKLAIQTAYEGMNGGFGELEKPLGARDLPAEQVSECVDDARACYQAWLKRGARTPY